MLRSCCQTWWKTADICYQITLFSSKTEPQLMHTAAVAQDWIQKNCPEFIRKDDRPPNSPDLNPMDYHVWGAKLEHYQKYTPKPTNVTELKTALLTIRNDLPLLQDCTNKAVASFRKRLTVCCCSWWTFWTFCLNTDWGAAMHIKHLNCWLNLCNSWIFNAQLRVHFKKWTLNFKMLYLLNRVISE